jgi:hypothetical protein
VTDVLNYSQRVARRLEVWWQKPRNYGSPATYANYLHQLRERTTFRSRSDPEETWHCCAYWPRSLINKWNSREFALRHGCRVPELYWYGRNLSSVPLESLPERYVIRHTFGSGRKRVYVLSGDREVTLGRAVSVAEMRARLGGPFRNLFRGRLLVEEFVGGAPGDWELPLECKLFMFGDVVGAIEVFRRSRRRLAPRSYTEGLGLTGHRCYSEAWEPFDDPFFDKGYLRRSYGHAPATDPSPPPDCLQELVAAGRRLGLACGTPIRVDFLIGDKGLVFNEFATTPAIDALTPFADAYLGRLWQELFPGAI